MSMVIFNRRGLLIPFLKLRILNLSYLFTHEKFHLQSRETMSLEKAFHLAPENFVCASLDVVIECFESLLDLLERWCQHGVGQYQHVFENKMPPPPEKICVPLVARASLSMMHPIRAQQFYVVAIGRHPKIYLSWCVVGEQVIGYGGNVCRATRRRVVFAFE